MVIVLKTSQGKVLTLNGDVLTTNVSGGGDVIKAINNTGTSISADDKVYIAPLTTTQSGANYAIVPVKTTDSFGLGFYTKGDVLIDLTNKTASSFYESQYLEVPKVFDYTQPWEFNICLQTGSSVSDTQWIYFGSTNAYSEGGLIIYLFDDKFLFDCYGTNDNLFQINNYSVAANTTYYVRIGWTGTEYYIQYSTNGTDWTSETPITSSVQVVQKCSSMRIGSRINNYTYFQGTVFLDKTYFISNGDLVWQALYDGTWSNIGKDVVTGIAEENIASGAVGNVSTILGA